LAYWKGWGLDGVTETAMATPALEACGERLEEKDLKR